MCNPPETCGTAIPIGGQGANSGTAGFALTIVDLRDAISAIATAASVTIQNMATKGASLPIVMRAASVARIPSGMPIVIPHQLALMDGRGLPLRSCLFNQMKVPVDTTMVSAIPNTI